MAKKAPAPAKKPSGYTRALADRICEMLAAGMPLRQICAQPGMPPRRTWRTWVDEDVDGLAARYARARSDGLDAIADEIQQIADTPLEGVRTEISSDGTTKEVREDMLGHRRLQIDARKWLLSKMRPDKYGDRIQHAGDPNSPLTITVRDLSKRDA